MRLFMNQLNSQGCMLSWKCAQQVHTHQLLHSKLPNENRNHLVHQRTHIDQFACEPLKTVYTMSTSVTKFSNHMYMGLKWYSILHIILCHTENKNIIRLGIDDPHTSYVSILPTNQFLSHVEQIADPRDFPATAYLYK